MIYNCIFFIELSYFTKNFTFIIYIILLTILQSGLICNPKEIIKKEARRINDDCLVQVKIAVLLPDVTCYNFLFYIPIYRIRSNVSNYNFCGVVISFPNNCDSIIFM